MKHKTRIAGAILAPTLALALIVVFKVAHSTDAACATCTAEPIRTTMACGTAMPDLKESMLVELAASKVAPPAVALVTIPVYFHVITTDEGVGDISDAILSQQVNNMNTGFAGSQGTGAANTSYRFTLAGIDRTANTAWYNAGVNTADEIAMKSALRQGSADDLNIYLKLSDVGGYSTFPWGYAARPLEDGIVSPTTNMPGDGMIHEAGHWLGLYHTFQGGCDINNDFVSDTPAEAAPNRTCPLPRNLDTCTAKSFSGKDPTDNFMDYTPDACRFKFTAGQSSRMNIMYNAHRLGK